MFCHFYLVRHGETLWNTTGKLQGQLDSPLTETGIRQAMERSKTFQEIEFADAFSSDLFRAKRTAEIIVADKKLAIKTNQLLRERNFGVYDGKLVSQFLVDLHDQLEYRESLSEEKQYSHKLRADIESDEEIVTRMLTFFRETAVAYPDKNVLVVSHGSIIRSFLVKLGFATNQELSPGSIANLGFAQIDCNGVDFEVKMTEGITLFRKTS